MLFSCPPPGPQILLNRSLQLVQLNAAARELLERQPSVLALQNKQLQAPSQPLALARCLGLARGGIRATVLLRRPHKLALTLCAEPCRLPSLPWIAVRVSNPDMLIPDAALLQDLLDLSPMQSRVAIGLAQGLAPEELATSLQVPEAVIRVHIEQLLQHSGAQHISQLVALVLQSVAMLPRREQTQIAGEPASTRQSTLHGAPSSRLHHPLRKHHTT